MWRKNSCCWFLWNSWILLERNLSSSSKASDFPAYELNFAATHNINLFDFSDKYWYKRLFAPYGWSLIIVTLIFCPTWYPGMNLWTFPFINIELSWYWFLDRFYHWYIATKYIWLKRSLLCFLFFIPLEIWSICVVWGAARYFYKCHCNEMPADLTRTWLAHTLNNPTKNPAYYILTLLWRSWQSLKIRLSETTTNRINYHQGRY